MTGATYALLANILIAISLSVTFLALSRTSETFRQVAWFGVAYGVGALTPLSELLVHMTPYTGLFSACSFITFAGAFLVTAKGLSAYYRVPLSNRVVLGLFLASILGRAVTWGGPRDWVPYEILYQFPFAAGLGLCAHVVSRALRKRALDQVLMVMLWGCSASFLVKPFAAASLGSGATAKDYVMSTYALFSQSLSAVQLIAIALTLLLVVIRDMLAQTKIDPLSRLLNRRSFDESGKALFARMHGSGRLCTAIVFDLDYFKSINDTYGHAAGDEVIRAFAKVLRAHAPADAVCGRTGGEEFSLIVGDVSPELATRTCEAVRGAIEQLPIPALPENVRVTVSVGAAIAEEAGFSQLMARADRALYIAKHNGRNKVVTDFPQ